VRCAFLGFFALLAYTTAMTYEPEQHGYPTAEAKAVGRLVDAGMLYKAPDNWLKQLQDSSLYRPAKCPKWSKL
jgi:hypothetical protein